MNGIKSIVILQFLKRQTHRKSEKNIPFFTNMKLSLNCKLNKDEKNPQKHKKRKI